MSTFIALIFLFPLWASALLVLYWAACLIRIVLEPVLPTRLYRGKGLR